jgi:hypothetical protein
MKTTSFIRSNLLPNAGLVLPSILWAANTEAGLILPYAECGSFKYAAATSLAAAILSLAAAFVSWRTVRRNPSDASSEVTAFPESFGFVGLLSGLCGLLFAFALLLQAASSLVLTGCER